MSRLRLLPLDQFPPGVDRGDYVTLTMEEFLEAYDTFSAGLEGKLPRDPDYPTEYQEATTGKATPLPDTAFGRAWYAAGKLFDDEARRVSYYARVQHIMPIALSKKYNKYVDREGGGFHAALLMAIARVQFSSRTTSNAMRSSFDAEFRRQIAAVDSDDTDTMH